MDAATDGDEEWPRDHKAPGDKASDHSYPDRGFHRALQEGAVAIRRFREGHGVAADCRQTPSLPECQLLTLSGHAVAGLDLVNDTSDAYGNAPSVVAPGTRGPREVSRAPACNIGREPDDLSKSPNAHIRSQDACSDGPGVRGHLARAKSG